MENAGALHILVVDDEEALRETLTYAFSREGHRVTTVATGHAALDKLSTEDFDIVLLDVALGVSPNGYEVCRMLRERQNFVPVIMLTSLDSEADAVQGLETGADDYVSKPVGVAELRSRVRAVLRRVGPRPSEGSPVIRVGNVSLDRRQRQVSVRGQETQLTFAEFELFARLMAEPGRLFTREELLEAIWGASEDRDVRAIDLHIRHLREKLEDRPEKPTLILTVRGQGYRLQGA
jgi:DNA-binding response OmpR family regulator